VTLLLLPVPVNSGGRKKKEKMGRKNVEGLTTLLFSAVLLTMLAHRPQAAQELLFPLIQDYSAKKPEGLSSIILVCARLSAVCPPDYRPHYIRKLVLPAFSCMFILCCFLE
jgi:hypothetical protein